MKRSPKSASVLDLGAARAARGDVGDVAREKLERVRVLCLHVLAVGDSLTLNAVLMLQELGRAVDHAEHAVRRCLSRSEDARAELADCEFLLAIYEAKPGSDHNQGVIALLRNNIEKLQETIEGQQPARC
jgi:hypothetical protein